MRENIDEIICVQILLYAPQNIVERIPFLPMVFSLTRFSRKIFISFTFCILHLAFDPLLTVESRSLFHPKKRVKILIDRNSTKRTSQLHEQ